MKNHLSLPFLLLSLLLLFNSAQLAHAQSDNCPRIYRDAETLRTDPAQSYQWYRNGEPIPGATQQSYVPNGPNANYSVVVEGRASTPLVYELVQVTLIGQAFDEHLRPVVNARITVGSQSTQSDAQGRFQFAGLSNEPTILLRGEKAGHWTSQRRIIPTGRQTQVQLMLRSQPFEHELSAERGGTISRGAFFLTLQPNGVLDANNQPYNGVVKIALNGGRPNDPNFGWMMPGGDFMAQDAQGSERILYSYGFLSAHLQTPSGQPLKLDPNIGAQLRFVMPHTMAANAPDSMPLWHFDEAASIWKEEGLARREGAAYVGTVRHFSSWNCDVPSERATVRGRVVDCKGRPITLSPIRVGQAILTTDTAGLYTSFVPSQIEFTVRGMGQNLTDTIQVRPLQPQVVENLSDLNSSESGLYGYGVIDTSNTLTIYSYDTKGSVEYSIDSGATYRASNRFETQIDKSYQVLVRDSMDCPTKVPYINLSSIGACQLLNRADLFQTIRFTSIESALDSDETVYRLSLSNILQFPVIIRAYFPCLQELLVNDNQLTSLPESFGNLSLLQMLMMQNNQLTSLPESFGELTQLQTLHLNNNQLTSLPESFGNLTQLQTLLIDNNQLTSLPESFGNLTRLPKLELHYNQLTSLPQSIGNLTQLQMLDLQYNQLTSLPQSIGNLIQLQSLRLNYNQLTSLPDSIGNLTRLPKLELLSNQLTSLPESIGNLTQLQEIDLENNQLTSLPESIGNISQLQTLRLSSNLLTSLPESIGSLSQLQTLRLSSNLLTSLTESIASLTQLKMLDLSNNQLTSLPDSLANLSQLQTLMLERNQLTSLPESIGNLTELQQLGLDGNQLTSLSEYISNLSKLQQLGLDGNQLTSLPESIANLTQLKMLNLSNNQLTSLPESIGNLTQLQILELSNNQLTSLPESISNLTDLIELRLTGNPIPPAEIERIRRLLPNCQVYF
jgi:Leucine-rich repeat (LRR) protein